MHMACLGSCAVLALAGSSLFSPLAACPLDEGVDFFRRGEFLAARDCWLSQPDNADALFNLGQIYRHGRGVPADQPKAREFYEQAAAKSHTGAQIVLARLLIDEGNSVEAARHLARAAVQGEADANLLLGSLYVNGDGVPRDLVLGYAHLLYADRAGVDAAGAAIGRFSGELTENQRATASALADRLKSLAVSDPVTQSPPQAPASKVPARAVRAPTRVDSLRQDSAAAPSWQIQLGAFGSQAEADAAWKRMSRKHASLLAGRTASFIPYRQFVRLRTSAVSRASATALCRSLSMQNQACFVAGPTGITVPP